MGRGAGGGDLNMKKSWHTATFRNQERVWKAQQQAKEEDKKMEQLRKELQEEQQMEALQRMQEQAGLVKKRAERVDWMYSGHAAAAGQLQEEYLLGKRRLDQKGASEEPVAESLAATNAAQQDRDAMAKIREDPMFSIRKREQESVKEIITNPVKMRQIKEKKKKKIVEKFETDLVLRHQQLKEKLSHEHQNKRARSKSPEATARGAPGAPRPAAGPSSASAGGSSAANGPTSLPFAPVRPGPAGYSSPGRPSGGPPGQGNWRPGPARPTAMSAEERQARLAAMQNDAAWNDQMRNDRVRQFAVQDAMERARMAAQLARQGQDPSFLESVKRNTYMGNEAASLAERVQRNRHLIEKPAD